MLLKTFTLTGTIVQIIPPDGLQHDGRWSWTVINGAATVTLYDDELGDGTTAVLAASTPPFTILAEDEELFAKGSGTLTVIGATAPQ